MMSFLYSRLEEKKGDHMISHRAHFSGKTITLIIAPLPLLSLAYFLIFRGMHCSIELYCINSHSSLSHAQKLFLLYYEVICLMSYYNKLDCSSLEKQ